MRSWTRVTTIAGTLADRFGLEKWALRNTVLGLGARHDLYALAASCTPTDKEQLNLIVDQAQEAAKAKSGANLGTALHRLTERVDSGEQLDVPDAWKPDVDAYCQTLADNHVQIHSEFIERVVVHSGLGYAGTLDRVVTFDGALTVSDLKTGQHAVAYGAGDIAIQLALYANATHMWNHTTDRIQRDRYGRYLLPEPDTHPDDYTPMPPVDTKQGLVVHLPVGQAECYLHTADLVAGWDGAQQAMWVREWRKRKNLATPVTGRRLRAVPDDDW